LVDIHDRPYDEVTSMLGRLDVQRMRAEDGAASRTLQERGGVSAGIPRGPEEPFENFVAFKAMKNWDRERGYIRAQTPAPLADLYVCWRPRAIYLGVHGWDAVEAGYYRSGWVAKEDRAVWSVRVGGKEIARARIGGGREGMVNDAAVKVESIPLNAGSAWMTAGMEVPVKVLERKELGVGDEIELECELVMHGRASRVEWRGKFKLVE
jgi:hypothetical protein